MTSISVNDPVAAFMFYTRTIGFAEKHFLPEDKIAVVVSAEDIDGTAILLEPRGSHDSDLYFDGLYDNGIPVLVLGTNNIEAEYERLKDKGVVFRQPPTKTAYGTTAIFDDTCGNYVQIYQP